MMLTHAADQVARDEELLGTAKDYFHFATKFFEPISVSAVHIYHSALELSPLSSIVRRLYYHRRHTPFPRVVAGTADSWDKIIQLFSTGKSCNGKSFTWSPCGHFVAAISHSRVQIRDAISSELVSTLAKGVSDYYCTLTYSPDGHSLALLSTLSDTLMIWDIQTGGAANQIESEIFSSGSIVWSLDGTMVGMTQDSTVHLYDFVSGATWSPGTLQSSDKLHLWAHNGSFRVMAGGWEGGVFTIEVFDVGSDLIKIETFHIELSHRGPDYHPHIQSFSPTTYRISTSDADKILILDIRNSECLLEDKAHCWDHTFSSDGSLFAAPQTGRVYMWRYASGCYTPWRAFPESGYSSPIRFSPTLSSILTHRHKLIQVHPLEDPPAVAHPGKLLAILSPCGVYIATARRLGHTVTIANPLSQTTSQFIDTDMEIGSLALIGTILLVFDPRVRIAAWRLTEGGLVDGVFGGRRAGDSDSIWAREIPTPSKINDRATVFWEEGYSYAYHIGTGEAIDSHQVRHERGHSPKDMSLGLHYPHYFDASRRDCQPRGDWTVPLVSPIVGWVKDPKGKHRLWMPVEWRTKSMGWFYDIQTLWFDQTYGNVIIMF